MFKKAIWGVSLSLVIAGLFAFTPAADRYFDIARNLDIFTTLYKEVNTYYVDEVNPSKVMKTGIDAMLESLDPYTNYIPEDEIEDYRTMTTGQYGGIGAVIGKRDKKTIVLMMYEGYPAHKGGLKIGDELISVDGNDVKEKNTGEVSKLLKGQAATTAKLLVRRLGNDKPFEIVLTREKIKIDNIPYVGMVTEDIGYFHLTDFTTNSSREVKDAINTLKERGAKKIIFDLRDNPGGLLNEAINICNLFIPKDKEVVSTKGKVTEWNKIYMTLNTPIDTEMQMVVLTSSHSASASEIVAGTMQDYDRAVLVGRRTYGKGLVQATRPLTFNSQLKVTTAKYYIPSGRCIQALDYTHRNADGSVGKVPDSLKQAFKTKNGRVVYDGGGVDPDINVKIEDYAEITQSLLMKSLIFDYATQYAYEHPTIAPAKIFKISDADYASFVKWLDGKDYDYTTQVEKEIETLIEASKKESYYESIKDQIQALKTKVNHSKEKDLTTFSDEIKDELQKEIVSRYYLQKGIVESSFNRDDDIKDAIKVLNDPARYNSLLKKN